MSVCCCSMHVFCVAARMCFVLQHNTNEHDNSEKHNTINEKSIPFLTYQCGLCACTTTTVIAHMHAFLCVCVCVVAFLGEGFHAYACSVSVHGCFLSPPPSNHHPLFPNNNLVHNVHHAHTLVFYTLHTCYSLVFFCVCMCCASCHA